MGNTKHILPGVLAVLLVLVTALPISQTATGGPRRHDDVTWVSEARQANHPARALGAPVKLRLLALLAIFVRLALASGWVSTSDERDALRPERHRRWAARSRRGPPAFA